MSWTAKAATLGATKAVYLESGDPHASDVVVLLHAFPVGMRMWEGVTVPGGWRAVAPALSGFDGVDPPPPASSNIDDYAQFVLELLNVLEIDTAVVGGVSMGGYVTFAAWRRDPRRWRGMILADTKASADSEQARAGRQKLLDTLRTKGTRAVAEEMVPKLLGATTRNRKSPAVDHVSRLIERQTTEGLSAAVVRLRDRPDSLPLLPEIAVPVIVAVGQEDEVTPVADSEAMHAQLPDSRLVQIPAAGHLACLENPSEFNAALAAFLNEIRG